LTREKREADARVLDGTKREVSATSLFSGRIGNWKDWGRVFQSIELFTPLMEHIFCEERLPFEAARNLTPGTNAVFKVGKYVIKIFAPAESGIDQTMDMRTELFAMKRAEEVGVRTPRLVARGMVEDKYRFAYLITEYIEGVEFVEAVKTMSRDEKISVARRLREATDRMNTACEPFNGIDVINDENRRIRWDARYTERFRAERLAYIKTRDYGEQVFAHGDLCGDNIILSPDGELFIIDFADSVLAPVIYERAHVAVELFRLDPDLLYGYFGNTSALELTELCFDGILIHDFGGDIVASHIGEPGSFARLEDFRKRLRDRIESELRFTDEDFTKFRS